MWYNDFLIALVAYDKFTGDFTVVAAVPVDLQDENGYVIEETRGPVRFTMNCN
jgi:hypothetical protein